MRSRPEWRHWYKLALALGMSVAQAQREISAREFAGWIAYDQLDPYGLDRVELIGAQICATLANLHSKRRYKPADFMPQWDRPPRRSVEEQHANFMLFMKQHNARMTKPNGNHR